MKLEQRPWLKERKPPSEGQRTFIIRGTWTKEKSVGVNKPRSRSVKKDSWRRSERGSVGHPRSGLHYTKKSSFCSPERKRATFSQSRWLRMGCRCPEIGEFFPHHCGNPCRLAARIAKILYYCGSVPSLNNSELCN